MENEHEFYMGFAIQAATASRSTRVKVGAVLVRDGNVLAFGYNGTPAGFPNECEIDGQTKPEVLHAESNAIAKCARTTQSADGATLYVTTAPCLECAKLIIQAGIAKVFWASPYRNYEGIKLLLQAHIPTENL